MLLAEIVSDQRDISWILHLPLLLHVSFLGKLVFIDVSYSKNIFDEILVTGKTLHWMHSNGSFFDNFQDAYSQRFGSLGVNKV